MDDALYEGLADEYAAFRAAHADYYEDAGNALQDLLGNGSGRCLDLGCGGGHFFDTARAAGWTVVGVDASRDQLRIARASHPDVELVPADARSLPFDDESFDAGFSAFTHTDFGAFADAMREVRRVLKPAAPFAYVGNHPCFVGPAQEHVEGGVPVLHPGYGKAGRHDAASAPGTTPGGWRARLGSFVHLPLADFLNAFAGFEIEKVVELDHGREYPTAIALGLRKPA